MPSFNLDISYSQICVFLADLENPFNDWEDRHVKQGFAWRRDSVSFKTLYEAGLAEVSFQLGDQVIVRSDTLRAIQVPFVVGEIGMIEIASIADSNALKIAAGEYLLLFETGLTENRQMWCSFSFVRSEAAAPAILRADKELNPSFPLWMDAVPAV